MAAPAPQNILQAHQTKDHNEISRWVIIYPSYINANATQAEGRRIAKEKCVPDPTLKEIFLALDKKKTGLDCLVEEHKSYSRNFTLMGRIRVHLKKSDGAPINPTLKDRLSLLNYVSETIAATPARVAEKAALAQAAEEAAAAAAKLEKEKEKKASKSKGGK